MNTAAINHLPRIIPRAKLAEIDDKLKRHDIAMLRLLAEKHPGLFMAIALEIRKEYEIALTTPEKAI